jgi:hypothetical protein
MGVTYHWLVEQLMIHSTAPAGFKILHYLLLMSLVLVLCNELRNRVDLKEIFAKNNEVIAPEQTPLGPRIRCYFAMLTLPTCIPYIFATEVQIVVFGCVVTKDTHGTTEVIWAKLVTASAS